MISTLSNVVFERLPAYDESPAEPASEKEEDQPSTGGRGGGAGGDDGETGGEGGKEARKQWGQGEGPPIIELLQHKQLQTTTYAVDDGNTGSLREREREREYLFGTFCPVGETRIVFSKLEGPLPTPVPVTISESEAEPQTVASIGETVTLKKAEENDLPQKLDKTSPKKEPSAEVLPSESWVIVKPPEVDQSVTKEKLADKTEGILDQPATSNSELPSSDQEVKQVWNGSSGEQGSTSVAQQPPAAPSSSSVSDGGAGKDIEVEDIEEREVKEDGIGEAVSNAVFTFGEEEEEEEEEPEERFSTPSAATPQVSNCRMVH